MQISWYGNSTVEFKQKKSSLLLNANKDTKADSPNVLVFDRTDEKNPDLEDGLMVDWPGEYDTAGFSFKGHEVNEKDGDKIIYTFHMSEGNVAWLGEISEYPSAELIKAMGEIHVLMLPVGGKDVLNAKDAFKLVEELEPMVVIPISYGDKRGGLSDFLKEMDVKHPAAQKSFDFKRSNLSEDKMDLVILEN